jgi:hypothetical protein
MALRTRRRQAWLATLTLSVGALAISSITVSGRAADGKRDSGIYLESADTGGKDEPKKLPASMAEMKPEGLGASMATMGFKKPKMVTTISGEKSGLRAPAQSTFLFVFSEGNGGRGAMSPGDDPMAAMAQMQGQMSSLPARTSTKDYMLLGLTAGEGVRVYNSGNKKEFKFTVEKVEANVYRIKPSEPLPPGEYGFAYNQGGGAAGMIWDFGIDGASTK